MQLTGRGLIGVAAKDGKFPWSYNAVANDTANIPTPIVPIVASFKPVFQEGQSWDHPVIENGKLYLREQD